MAVVPLPCSEHDFADLDAREEVPINGRHVLSKDTGFVALDKMHNVKVASVNLQESRLLLLSCSSELVAPTKIKRLS